MHWSPHIVAKNRASELAHFSNHVTVGILTGAQGFEIAQHFLSSRLIKKSVGNPLPSQISIQL
jgi:hypothetical protein